MARVIYISASLSSVFPSVESMDDDGVASCTVYLTVKDSRGEAVQGLAASQCVLAVSPSTGVTLTQPTGFTDRNGLIAGSFVSTNPTTVTASYTVKGLAITDTASVDVGSAQTEPTPSGTIFYDFRTGGAQSLQTMTSVADVNTAINGVDARGAIPDGEQVGSWAFTTNYDGANKRALRVDWPQNVDAQSSVVATVYYPDQYANVYTSFVMHLGKTATGGGLGSNGSFVPRSAGGGMKRFMWLRNADSGTDRVYWVWPSGTGTTGNALSIDNLNLDIPFTADYGVGVDVRWTFQLVSGSPSTVRVWRDGVLVLEDTDAGIGTLGFEESQFVTTRFDTEQAESEYLTDLVMWTV